jgi:hypothetical protein
MSEGRRMRVTGCEVAPLAPFAAPMCMASDSMSGTNTMRDTRAGPPSKTGSAGVMSTYVTEVRRGRTTDEPLMTDAAR